VTTNAIPTAQLPAVAPPGERIATGLHLLADLAAAHPAVAALLATTVEQLTVVVQRGTNPDLLGDALVERGAHRLPAPTADVWWTTDLYELPGGAAHVAVTRLDTAHLTAERVAS
jgi:hypothetical protein